MATKRKVLSQYTKKQLPKYEQQYAEKEGTLRGFKTSPEYRKFKRNKKAAEYRYNAKKRDANIIREVGKIEINVIGKGLNTPEPTYIERIEQKDLSPKIENLVILENNAPFFFVLSYGSEDDKSAIEGFSLAKELGSGRATAIVDSVEIDGQKRSYTSAFDYQMAIMDLFKKCREQQTALKTYPTITIASATVNGRETIWVKIQSQSTWQKPQPKKRQNPKQ